MRLVLDEPKDSDDQIEFEGMTYLIDQQLHQQIGDAKVDFVDNGWQQGFVLSTSNPLPGSGASCSMGSGGSCSC